MSIRVPDPVLVARLAALDRWSRLDHDGRLDATAPMRQAAEERFTAEARRLLPDGAGEEDVRKAAKGLKRAHAIRAARARWAK
jgi:hypothetical protein